MSLFDGLYGYEAVLLVLGALSFAALVALLIFQLMHNRPYSGLVLCFTVPLALMGLPGIQKMELRHGALSLDESTHIFETNPTDDVLRSKLESRVTDLANRPTSNPDLLTSIASAQFALGKHSAAEATLSKALAAGPVSPEAQDLQQRLQLDRSLVRLTMQLQESPKDGGARQQLQTTVTQAAALHSASHLMRAHLANAQAVLAR